MANKSILDITTIDNDSSSDSASPQTTSQEVIDLLREDIIRHFQALNLPVLNGSNTNGNLTKGAIRASHAYQRSEIFQREVKALRPSIKRLLPYFANGDEINPSAIDPELVPVGSKDDTGRLFRFAALLWSVPVSQGYGRRMRFLVKDRSNAKLIGIFALGDPVFNLKCRDDYIGWNVHGRRTRLVNVMDAYVVGAVPPYNQLLGGKLVTSLIGSDEVSQAFSEKYSQTTGIISQEQKAARLSLVTVTSALGRSSIYNRLKLLAPDGSSLVNLTGIGETRGYGHFQLSNDLFERIRQMLADENHPYANGHQYGQGPNWRFRVLRVGLKRLGLDEELIRHGIHREVFAMPMTPNFKDFLCGRIDEININRPSAKRISAAALQRWIIPRAERYPDYFKFNSEHFLDQLLTGKQDTDNRIHEQHEIQLTFNDTLLR